MRSMHMRTRLMHSTPQASHAPLTPCFPCMHRIHPSHAPRPRLLLRDRYALDEWEASGLPYHVFRDHPAHTTYSISGGRRALKWRWHAVGSHGPCLCVGLTSFSEVMLVSWEL
jgi:hypothetical protein